VSTESEELLNAWRQSAEYWSKHRATVRRMFAPVTSAIVEEARIRRGQNILDVAGGPGEPSLTIAEAVGPDGAVTYTDAVSGMVETARNEAGRQNITNISFLECRADGLPFSDDSFDVVTCRFGVMLFSDPPASLREMLRVTKPGGVVVLAVWHTSEMNPFLNAVTRAMARHVESPPSDPCAPGAFRFAEPGSLVALFREAGAENVQERILSFKIEAPIAPSDFWPLRVDLSDTLRDKVQRMTPAQLAVIESEVQEEISQFFGESGMSFPASAIIVSGMKSTI